MKRNMLLALLVCILLVGSSLNYAVAQTAGGPRYGGTLVIATGTETPTLNPALYDRIGHPGRIYSSLVQHDLNLVPQPDLAESWVISDDGKRYVFNLVRNATFHDGMPVTSADVKFSIEDAMIPHHPLGKVIWEQLDSIDTPDDYTVVINLKEPFSALMFFLDIGPGGPPILPKHLYEGTDIPTNPYNQNPIGSGPFKFVRWDRGNQLVLERNENYFREGLPYLDRIIIRTIAESTSAAMALERGEVHYIPGGGWGGLAYSDINRLRNVDNIIVTTEGQEGTGSVLSLVANLDHPIIGELNVRKAIAHAIDKNLIIERVYYGETRPALTPLSSEVAWAFNPDVRQYEFNPEKANMLLDEAGYPRGPDGKRFEINLHNIAGRADRLHVIDIVKEQLRHVGIESRIISLEISAYDDIVIRDRQFDLALEGWASGPDPSVELASLFHSKQFGVFLGNGANYNNLQVDELFDAAGIETDILKKAQLLREVQEHLAEDLPFIPLLEINRPSAYRNEFVGLPSSPWVPTEPMLDVWWTGGRASYVHDAGATVVPRTDEDSILPVIAVLLAVIAIGGGIGAHSLRKRNSHTP